MYQVGTHITYPVHTSRGWRLLKARVSFFNSENELVEIRYLHPDLLGQWICKSFTARELTARIVDGKLKVLQVNS